MKPERSEPWAESLDCTGKPTSVTYVYSEADAGVLNIIGWDFLGKSFEETYAPDCGQEGGHEAHLYEVAGGMHLFRTCAHCGHENKETTA
jgi:hypothetical protein